MRPSLRPGRGLAPRPSLTKERVLLHSPQNLNSFAYMIAKIAFNFAHIFYISD